MSSIYLTEHPSTPCPAVRLLWAEYVLSPAGRLSLSYYLEADTGGLLIPAYHHGAGRRDELWQHTCLEMFMHKPGDCAYWEFNFSPSGDWAIYHFDAYRAGMTAPEIDITPTMQVTTTLDMLRLDISINCAALKLWSGPDDTLQASLAAVVETVDQQPTYWAMKHATDKPDFHHPESFVLTLKALHGDVSGSDR